VGAGLVTLAVPAPLHAALAGQVPEATWILLPSEMGVVAEGAAQVLRSNLQRATALLIGPGFGLEDTTKHFINRFIDPVKASRKAGMGFAAHELEGEPEERAVLPPLVFDADGLKLLARLADWHRRIPAPAVLTPHPGEMAILTGLSTGEIQNDRSGIAERFAAEWGHVVVLKGAITVVAAPDGQAALIPVATPALARAGTGDVLAGIIGGLLAQGMKPFQAASCGAWIHAQAGLKAAEAVGNTASVLAGDVLAAVVDVMNEVVL
jgi:NAD(P)H-hydrate epimerase